MSDTGTGNIIDGSNCIIDPKTKKILKINYNRSISVEQQEIQDLREGKLHTWQVSISLPNATPKYFLPVKTDQNKIITLDPFFPFATAGTIRINFYILHNYAGGTERVDTYNRNGDSPIPATFKIYEDPIGTEKGFNFSQIDVGTQSTNQSSGGGAPQSPQKSIYGLSPFLVECINNSGDAAFLNVVLGWKEEDK